MLVHLHHTTGTVKCERSHNLSDYAVKVRFVQVRRRKSAVVQIPRAFSEFRRFFKFPFDGLSMQR